jgi:hypothetical protein
MTSSPHAFHHGLSFVACSPIMADNCELAVPCTEQIRHRHGSGHSAQTHNDVYTSKMLGDCRPSSIIERENSQPISSQRSFIFVIQGHTAALPPMTICSIFLSRLIPSWRTFKDLDILARRDILRLYDG